MPEPGGLVLRAAGINCEAETVFGLERAGCRADVLHVNRLMESPRTLQDHGLLVIPGGFSYGDHICGGKVLAVELAHAMEEHLRSFVDRGGLILGICNGFQVLVQTGLLPGAVQDPAGRATLQWNDSHRYEDRWVHLRADPGLCPMVPDTDALLSFPVGHGEGRFTMRDPASVGTLAASHQVAFTYVDPGGGPAAYPHNPNGSMGGVAGVCDPTGRILGLMPHPDRALFPWSHPAWTREPERMQGDGTAFFEAVAAALR